MSHQWVESIIPIHEDTGFAIQVLLLRSSERWCRSDGMDSDPTSFLFKLYEDFVEEEYVEMKRHSFFNRRIFVCGKRNETTRFDSSWNGVFKTSFIAVSVSSDKTENVFFMDPFHIKKFYFATERDEERERERESRDFR